MALSRHFLRAPRLFNQCQRLAFAQQKCNASDGPAELHLTFSTPSEVFYRDIVVKQIDVPSQAGDFGICVSHVPTIAALKPGVISVYGTDGTDKKYFVGGGAITVNSDSTVQILAEEAHPLDRFDSKAVMSSLADYQKAVNSAKNEQEKAEAMIAVECLEALKNVV